MFLPLLDTAVAPPRVLEPRNKSCFPLTQRTGRRGPVGSSQKPTTVLEFAEIAVARLLWLPGGCPREILPVVRVHARLPHPCNSRQVPRPPYRWRPPRSRRPGCCRRQCSH